jgi:hypothetical protein
MLSSQKVLKKIGINDKNILIFYILSSGITDIFVDTTNRTF